MLIHERDQETDKEKNCSFCGERKASALWMGAIDIFCCSHCASELLPQLMADAIVGGTSINDLKKSTGATVGITKEERILKRFHSSFGSALIRKIRV